MEFRAEDDCLFVGGPFDEDKLSIPPQAEEWAFPNYAASLTASWQDALPVLQEELAEKDPDSISPHEEAELDERVFRALQDAHEQYAKPAPGGVLAEHR